LFTSPGFLLSKDVRYAGFGDHQILSNLLKYSSQKIVYNDGEFSSGQKYTSLEGICGDILGLSHPNPV
jgi:hypothetical protein